MGVLWDLSILLLNEWKTCRHNAFFCLLLCLSSKWKADRAAVTSLCVSPDGKLLLSAGHVIKMWDLDTKELYRVSVWVFYKCYYNLTSTLTLLFLCRNSQGIQRPWRPCALPPLDPPTATASTSCPVRRTTGWSVFGEWKLHQKWCSEDKPDSQKHSSRNKKWIKSDALMQLLLTNNFSHTRR